MRPQARPIEFQSYGNKEVVNYSAIANKAKQLSDNIRTVAFDQVNDSITFKSSLIHDKPPVSIKPSDNSINNVSSINYTDGSTITGITSDSLNTDPTKAISANILTDLNTRFTALESKTQNQTATENETTFTGNVTANTFNGFHLGMNNSFYKLPAIPIIRDDLVMEVGRYIDFHYNNSTSIDYKSRLSISSQGTLHYDHSFIVDGGDIKARNCIANGGNLNDIASRTKSLESKNTEQDGRLDSLESKDIAHEERLGSIEAMDTAQNESISNINTKNDEQDTRLEALESKTQNQSASENETTFTGNITANTINGYRIGYKGERPSIITVEPDGVVNVNTYIKFHWSNTYDTCCQLEYDVFSLSCNIPFTAPNIKSNNEDRLKSAESKNTEQDTRLNALDESLGGLDTRVSALENDTTLSDRMNGFDESLGGLDTRVSALENDTTDSDRLDAVEAKDTEQDERLEEIEYTSIPIIHECINNIDDKLTIKAIPQINSLNTITSTHTSQITDIETRLSEVEKYFDKVYPIGSVWVTVSNTTPPIGTWKIQNNGYAAYLLTNSAGTNIAGPLVYMYIRTA